MDHSTGLTALLRGQLCINLHQKRKSAGPVFPGHTAPLSLAGAAKTGATPSPALTTNCSRCPPWGHGSCRARPACPPPGAAAVPAAGGQSPPLTHCRRHPAHWPLAPGMDCITLRLCQPATASARTRAADLATPGGIGKETKPSCGF